MVGDMLALRPPPTLLSEHLARHSEGNPFFVAEYMRLAVAERLVTRDEAGHWRLPLEHEGVDPGARYGALQLPGTIKALVSRRFEDLGPEAVAMLHAASVLGREGDSKILFRLCGQEEDACLKGLSELLQRQILEESERGRVRFVHEKLREGAYDDISEPAKRQLHRVAADTLEAQAERERDAAGGTAKLEAHAATLAFHYLRAGIDGPAARYSWLAGRYATRTVAFPEALAHFEIAMSVLDRLPDEAAVRKLKVDVRLDAYRARMHVYSAADGGLLQLCREAEPIAGQIGDTERLSRLYAFLGGSYFARGEYDNCIAIALRGLKQADDDVERAAVAGYIAAMGLLQAGRISTLVSTMPPVVMGMERASLTTEFLEQTYPPYVTLAGGLGWALALQGRFRASKSYLEKAVSAARQSGSKYALALAHAMTSWSAYAQRDSATAVKHGCEAQRIARDGRMPGPEMFGLAGAGVGFVLSGDIEEGIAMLRQALAKSDEISYVAFRTDVYYGLALGNLARAEFDSAMEWCEAGLNSAVSLGERKLEGEFRRLLGENAQREVRREKAREQLQSARDICAVQGTTVFLVRALVALGRLELSSGRTREAEAALGAAADLLRTMDLPGEAQIVSDLLKECGFDSGVPKGNSPLRCR
jgi:tetratricopeptide (TPR) repeat protein